MTKQVDFYILGKAGLTSKLKYACRIAEQAYSESLTVYMLTPDDQHNQELDTLLWTFSQGSFVPHTIANSARRNWDHFPVQLGSDPDNGEGADLLISLIADIPRNYSRFGGIAELITDDPAEKSSGRNRFRYYREHGIEPNTHSIG